MVLIVFFAYKIDIVFFAYKIDISPYKLVKKNIYNSNFLFPSQLRVLFHSYRWLLLIVQVRRNRYRQINGTSSQKAYFNRYGGLDLFFSLFFLEKIKWKTWRCLCWCLVNFPTLIILFNICRRNKVKLSKIPLNYGVDLSYSFELLKDSF